MRKINKYLKILFVFMFLFVLSYSVSASTNMTTRQGAEKCLNVSMGIMKELSDNGFSVERINDTIKIAQVIYDAEILKEQKNKSDYSLVFSYCDDMESIKTSAYDAKDQLYSLEKDYEEFQKKISLFSNDPSLSPAIGEVDSMMEELRQEMKDERYEVVIEKTPQIQKKIIEVEASATTLNLFYATISRGVKDFIRENYISILVFIVILIVFYILYRTKFRKYVLARRIRNLESEKKVIQEMTKKLQREYFETGKVSEGDYRIRTRKFAEMIRDIERQIPLLREELAKITAKSKKGKEEKSIAEEVIKTLPPFKSIKSALIKKKGERKKK